MNGPGTVAPEPRRIEVRDGTRLHALSWSPPAPNGVPFLLVHGLASNATLWSDVAVHLAAHGHEVVAVDQRSHGRSEPSDELSTATLTADLLDVIRALDLDRPVAVGQSWGGNIVLELAHAAPGAVRGVAAVDGGTIDLAASFPSWEACWEALAPPVWNGELAFAELAARIEATLPDWPVTGRRAQLGNLAVRPDGTATAILTRERHRSILRSMWERRPSRLYPEIDRPVLLMPVDTGEAAWSRDKRDAVAAAETAIPRVRTVWFRGRHHDVHAQAPAEVADTLLQALADGMFDDTETEA